MTYALDMVMYSEMDKNNGEERYLENLKRQKPLISILLPSALRIPSENFILLRQAARILMRSIPTL